jgi:hypothetical protein
VSTLSRRARRWVRGMRLMVISPLSNAEAC